ncbi:hypothetical protein COO60DRAFT_858863 [Scenedesmus sp. NREL 46B-D3]|nr:hypothetical protein COO60DRAFT_858863 [Scenedesmus sp. NREL 46B-D3]
MAQQIGTLAGNSGQAQQELQRDAAFAALENRQPAEPVQILNIRKGSADHVAYANPATSSARGLLVGLQAPTKLYPPHASSSTAGSSGCSFAHRGACNNKVAQKPSLKWFSTSPHRKAAGAGSLASNTHISNTSSVPAMHAQAQQLALPQQTATTSIRQSPPSKAAAIPAVSCTLNFSSTAGSSSACSTHSRPLQLHKQHERDRNMGVLLMERRLAQLSAALQEAQALQEQYAQQLADADAAHTQRLATYRAQAHQRAAPQQAVLLQQRQRLGQVLEAWQSQAVQQQQRRTQQLGRAVRWQRRRLQRSALSTWHCMCVAEVDQRQRVHALRRRALLSRTFKGWAAACVEISKQSSSADVAARLQQQAVHAWRGWMLLQAQQRQLQQLHQQHVLRRTWQLWLQHKHSTKAQHAAASAAFAALGTRLLQRWSLQAFAEQLQEQQVCQHLQQRKVVLLVASWRQLSAAAGREKD